MTDETYYLTGADRLTVHQRPQGCVDLVLDGESVIAYLTGKGGNAVDLLSTAGLIGRRFGDPDAPPDPPDLVAVLAALVRAIDAAGILEPEPVCRAWPLHHVPDPERAPVLARRLRPVKAAVDRARRTIHQPPV